MSEPESKYGFRTLPSGLRVYRQDPEYFSKCVREAKFTVPAADDRKPKQ